MVNVWTVHPSKCKKCSSFTLQNAAHPWCHSKSQQLVHTRKSSRMYPATWTLKLTNCAQLWLVNQNAPTSQCRFKKTWSSSTTRAKYRFIHSNPGSVVLARSEEHTSELQSRFDLVCRLLL